MKADEVTLGMKVKDTLTECTGVVSMRIEYLGGRVEFGVQTSALKDGRPVDVAWFPPERLSAV